MTILWDDGALVCVTGLAHLLTDRGAIHRFRRTGRTWDPLFISRLSAMPTHIETEPSGSLLLRLRSGATLRYRSGRILQLSEPDPERNRTEKFLREWIRRSR